MEEWRPVRGFERDYEVSNLGRGRRLTPSKTVRNTHPGRILTAHKARHGYVRFAFAVAGKKHYVAVHRAVWEAFVAPIPPALQINHKNGVKDDNRLENLDCVTQSENVKWNYRVLGVAAPNNPQRGEKNGRAKLKEADLPRVFQLRAEGRSQQAIADLLGVSQTSVSRVLLGKSWKSQAKSVSYHASAGAATHAVATP